MIFNRHSSNIMNVDVNNVTPAIVRKINYLVIYH